MVAVQPGEGEVIDGYPGCLVIGGPGWGVRAVTWRCGCVADLLLDAIPAGPGGFQFSGLGEWLVDPGGGVGDPLPQVGDVGAQPFGLGGRPVDASGEFPLDPPVLALGGPGGVEFDGETVQTGGDRRDRDDLTASSARRRR